MNFTVKLSKTVEMDPFSFTFDDQEALNVHHLHDNAIVIAAHMVFRILIDNGSSVDILYTSAYDKMGLKREAL